LRKRDFALLGKWCSVCDWYFSDYDDFSYMTISKVSIGNKEMFKVALIKTTNNVPENKSTR